MKHLELAAKKMLKVGDLSIEDQIKSNILNFIRTIHLNELYLIESSFGTEFYDELHMTFQKKPGYLMGLITGWYESDYLTIKDMSPWKICSI